ncbi:DUF4179 domain-containing protein [Fredinandcohnia sp. QZ13]|uniref:DUF4179 domain-containing protein n=1 Tax=Fredinandcohnia sp. QZ13 TaxID=3073144 RepID=UPI0028530168|nr:DUF4179 domain-containing protein [Fredinandcohnia sp. QZ13]MDR4889719.1 DUF4179 domain-containing protein [Fredinandcohnia sp. QZ13]
MSKQYPEFNKELENIHVPVEKLDRIIQQTINEHNKQKPRRIKIILTTIGSVAAAFILFLGSATFSPTLAKVASEIPLVGTFFNESSDEGLQIAGKSGLTQVVNRTAKDNGVKLTMNEIFYDGTRLTFGMTHESLIAIGDIERPTILVNGKEINFGAGTTGKFITPSKYEVVMDIKPTEDLPEEFDMKVIIDAVGLIAGNWEFEFPVKQSNEVTVIRPNLTNVIYDTEVTVESVKIGPAGTDLAVQVKVDPNNTKIDPYMDLHFAMIDDQGRVLRSLSGSGHGEAIDGVEVANLDYLFTPIKDGAKSLTILPYKIPTEMGTFEELSVSLIETLPVEIDQGEVGKITVTDVEFLDDKTVVYFELDSEFPFDDNLTMNRTWLESKDGKDLTFQDNPFAKRIKGNLFMQEFEATKTKDVKFKATKLPKPITFEPFEITLP